MITRIVTVFLVTLLTIPAIPLMRQHDTIPPPWGVVAVAAKGKPHHKHKQKNHKQQSQGPQVPTTVTRTVRQSVTQTFTSSDRVAIPNDGDMKPLTFGKANPYPSAIDVSGFNNGTVTDVNLILNDFTHGFSADTDLLLSTGGGRAALVMSDVGDNPVANINLILDDEAAAPLPESHLTSGTFQPADIDFNETDDPFSAPAPAANGSVSLSSFDGADPNGTWQLWGMDDDKVDTGALGGWALVITAVVDVEVQEPVQAPATDNDGKHHKRTDGQHIARRREG